MIHRLPLVVVLLLSTSMSVGQPQEVHGPNGNTNAHSHSQITSDFALSVHDAAAPERAINELNKGMREELARRPTQAEKRFREALKIYPEFDAAKAGLGRALAQQGHWEEAEKIAVTAFESAPQHPSVLRLRASVLQHQKHYAESLPFVRRSLSLDPHSDAGLLLLARAEFKTDDCPNALIHAALAHQQRQHANPEVHLISALCQERAGLLGDAANEYKTYLQEHPPADAAQIVKRRLQELSQLAATRP